MSNNHKQTSFRKGRDWLYPIQRLASEASETKHIQQEQIYPAHTCSSYRNTTFIEWTEAKMTAWMQGGLSLGHQQSMAVLQVRMTWETSREDSEEQTRGVNLLLPAALWVLATDGAICAAPGNTSHCHQDSEWYVPAITGSVLAGRHWFVRQRQT